MCLLYREIACRIHRGSCGKVAVQTSSERLVRKILNHYFILLFIKLLIYTLLVLENNCWNVHVQSLQWGIHSFCVHCCQRVFVC